jgi:succinate-semialdehyde dehydrogenase/glutarate-semialdehyde dehydrogenase
VTDEMEVAREETFGPVIPITTISSDDEALQIATPPVRLLTAVWTRDLARGLRFAEAVDAGWVNVNESTNYWESHLPFGGRSGKSSGVGRVGGREAMRDVHRAEDRRRDALGVFETRAGTLFNQGRR